MLKSGYVVLFTLIHIGCAIGPTKTNVFSQHCINVWTPVLYRFVELCSLRLNSY